ncbi:MAG: hypothetical protein AAFR59_10340, partial [Bacteroidota bacterium]
MENQTDSVLNPDIGTDTSTNIDYLERLEQALNKAASTKEKTESIAGSDQKAYDKAKEAKGKLADYQARIDGTQSQTENLQLAVKGTLTTARKTGGNILNTYQAMKLLVDDLLWLAKHTERLLANGKWLLSLLPKESEQIAELEKFNLSMEG